MDDLRVCRCCLSTKDNEMSSKSSAQILQILTDYKSNILAFWLCYRCKHAMKKISQFRDMCLQAESSLRKYPAMLDKKQAKDYFFEEKNKLNLGNEPSFSNTLCLNVKIERDNSAISIVSFNRASKLQKNFTQNITTIIHRELKIGISPEPDIQEEFETNENNFLNSNIVIDNTTACCSDSLETVEEKYQPTEEFKMPINLIKLKVPIKQEVINESGEETAMDLSDEWVDSNSNQKMKNYSNMTQQPSTSLISKEIFEHVEKASEVVLSIEEQLKEKDDKSKVDSFAKALLECQLCVRTFHNQAALNNHTKTYYCVECNLHFKTASLLGQHLKKWAHCDQSAFKHRCSLCPRGYKSACHLIAHMTTLHNKGHDHVCKTCGDSFSLQRNLLNHIRIKHEGYNSPNIIACPMCNEKFSSKKILRDHIRTYTGKRPFKCGQCTCSFKTPTRLATHVNLVHLKLGRNVSENPKAPRKVASDSETCLDSTNSA